MIESHQARQVERRFQAGRPYYRPHNKHQISSREDRIYGAVMAVFVGALIGATITLAVMS